MNCQEFWNTIPQQGHGDVEHHSHLAECAACASQWERQRAVAAGLHLLAGEWRRDEAPPRVEIGLVAAFRAQSRHSHRRTPQAWWMPALAWASAAAAMVALGFLLIHGVRPDRVAPENVSAPHHTAAPGPELAIAAPDVDGDDVSSSLSDGFIRLPNAAPVEPNDDVNNVVVRVEVSRAQLVALGFTVSEDRAAEPVLADFALGPDGMARAVRFVNDSGTFE